MRQTLVFVGLLAIGFANAQFTGVERHSGKVSVNTETPEATFQIDAYKTDGTAKEGVLIPRLNKAAVIAMTTGANNAGNAFTESTLVYVTDEVADTDSGTFTGTGKGFYYYDATAAKWAKLGAGASAGATTTGTITGDGITVSDGTDAALKNITLGIADNAVTTNKIANATILAEDLNQMGATAPQMLTWTGTKWEPAYLQGAGRYAPLSSATPTCDASTVGATWILPDGIATCRANGLRYTGKMTFISAYDKDTVPDTPASVSPINKSTVSWLESATRFSADFGVVANNIYALGVNSRNRESDSNSDETIGTYDGLADYSTGENINIQSGMNGSRLISNMGIGEAIYRVRNIVLQHSGYSIPDMDYIVMINTKWAIRIR